MAKGLISKLRLDATAYELKNNMNNYDGEYLFIIESGDDGLPELTPDENTEDRRFSYLPQVVGSPPLVFFNGLRDRQRRRKKPVLKILPDVLFSGADLVVRTHIREALLQEDIPNLHMHPTVYIHDDGIWHEDYWYMTFTSRFDCWDRSKSDYEKNPLEIGGEKLYSIYSYSLDEKLMSKTPLPERKIFKIGGSQDGHIVCHASMTKHFMPSHGKYLMLTKVSEY